MSASVGSVDMPQDPMGTRTHATKQITVGAADYQTSTDFVCGFCRRIYCNATGTIAVQRDGDSAATTYNVQTGTILDGVFSLVGGKSNYASVTSGMVLNLEV